MCPVQSHEQYSAPALPFSIPRLHTGKNWYVDFFAYDPAAGKKRRKKIMLDHIPTARLRREQASEIIKNLLTRLRAGWSPWLSSNNGSFPHFIDVIHKYDHSLTRLTKAKTRHSYHSRVAILLKYVATLTNPPKYAYQYDTAFVSGFLDWLYLTRGVSGRTRNNYREWCSSLAGFLIERDYISSNPVDKIKSVSEERKKRQPLTPDMLSELRDHLSERNPMFLLACMMEYYTMIRPEELSNIKIADISLREQSIFVSGEFSKNKRDGKVALNDDIIGLMLDINLFDHPDNDYIFGDKLRPGSKKGSSEMFRREWKKVRAALRWSDEYQFYSLKDSGIRDLANSQGIVVARDQARHTDVATTNKYLQGRDLPVHNEVKHFKGRL